ncbi:DNA polymerase III subunit delta [Pseudahrensia aquimaris]|uniref:DNA polymerase III subunit delta n=1 Tax=Pseudahrensia aquimaris TaxID=744461 RepID=A0ABW3FE33_9HYPH
MAEVKAHAVDGYLKRPDPAHSVFLIYGPDAGLVSERAKILARSSGADLNDPFATVQLDAEDAASDQNRVADEAHTVSMFGGKRLVWIKGSTQKNLPAAIQPVLDTPPQDAFVIVEAGDLKKTAPLRTRVEKAKGAVALPCYADQAKALDAMIDEELRAANLTIANDTRQMLKGLLGEDRMASRSEVKKLCLYCCGQETISPDDILAIVGDASALAVDTVIDAAATGDISTMEHTYKRLLTRGTSEIQIVLGLQRYFQLLHQARAGMESTGSQAANAIARMRPPVNFQRKDKVTRALSGWTLPALSRALKRIDDVSLEARANASLAPALVSTTLLAIALEARHLRIR